MSPTNEPQPAFNARRVFFPSISSKATAPRKGPNTMPHGPKNSPTNSPSVLPQTPIFDPPKRLVPQMGTTESSTWTTMVTTAHMTRNCHENCTLSVACRSKSPQYAKGTPGRTGNTQPRIPTKRHMAPKMMRKVFIISCLAFHVGISCWSFYVSISCWSFYVGISCWHFTLNAKRQQELPNTK